MIKDDMNIYIDVKSMSTSPLTWHDYADMVQLAIENNITNFIFSNDDIDYKFYAESRFKTFISNAKINLGIGNTTVNYIHNQLSIHYAIDPKNTIEIERLLNSLDQESISSAYVIWDENHLDESMEAIQTIHSLKKDKVLSRVGISIDNKNALVVMDKIRSICEIDYVVINDTEYPNKTFTRGKNVLFSSTMNSDIFLLINLLFKKSPVLRSDLDHNNKLKEFLSQFLNDYSIENVISKIKSNNVNGLILRADNAEILKYLLSTTKNATNSVSQELIQELVEIKNDESELWWNK